MSLYVVQQRTATLEVPRTDMANVTSLLLNLSFLQQFALLGCSQQIESLEVRGGNRYIHEDLPAVTTEHAWENRMNGFVMRRQRQIVPMDLRANDAAELCVLQMFSRRVIDEGEQVAELFFVAAQGTRVDFLIDLLGMLEPLMYEELEGIAEADRARWAMILPEAPIDEESILTILSDTSIGISLVFSDAFVLNRRLLAGAELFEHLRAKRLVVRLLCRDVIGFVLLEIVEGLGVPAADKANQKLELPTVAFVVIHQRGKVVENLRAHETAEF